MPLVSPAGGPSGWYSRGRAGFMEPTTIDPDPLNIQLAEMRNVCRAAGIMEDSKTDHTQLLQAINILIEAKVEERLANVVSAPIGGFMFWNGVGSLNGVWAVCDGTNGTPNLMDAFIRCGWGVGTTGGAASVTVNTELGGGIPARSTGGTVLTVAQLARHKHPMGDKVVSDRGSGGVIQGYDKFASGLSETEEVGDNQPHDHPMDAVDPHGHPVTVPTMPPFATLIPIMRVA